MTPRLMRKVRYGHAINERWAGGLGLFPVVDACPPEGTLTRAQLLAGREAAGPAERGREPRPGPLRAMVGPDAAYSVDRRRRWDPVEHQPAPWCRGSRTSYVRGCRCDRCRAAQRAYDIGRGR